MEFLNFDDAYFSHPFEEPSTHHVPPSAGPSWGYIDTSTNSIPSLPFHSTAEVAESIHHSSTTVARSLPSLTSALSLPTPPISPPSADVVEHEDLFTLSNLSQEQFSPRLIGATSARATESMDTREWTVLAAMLVYRSRWLSETDNNGPPFPTSLNPTNMSRPEDLDIVKNIIGPDLYNLFLATRAFPRSAPNGGYYAHHRQGFLSILWVQGSAQHIPVTWEVLLAIELAVIAQDAERVAVLTPTGVIVDMLTPEALRTTLFDLIQSEWNLEPRSAWRFWLREVPFPPTLQTSWLGPPPFYFDVDIMTFADAVGLMFNNLLEIHLPATRQWFLGLDNSQP